MKILFLTVKVFSAGSGIEKVCRVAGKALYEYSKESQQDFIMYSLCDKKEIKTEPYFPSAVCKGFAKAKIWFLVRSLQQGIKSRVVVLNHINLLWHGYLIKLFSPKTKVILIAHGKEAYRPLSSRKKKILKHIDLIVAVSDFTKEKMKALFDIPERKFRVLNNCVDPFLPEPADDARRSECRGIYGIAENDFLLMTLGRHSSTEKSKGYDKVLIAVKKLHASFPNVKYVMVGKFDAHEKTRLDSVIYDLGIEDDVIFTGFVPDAVLADFYNIADVYIMPREKKGFGFTVINALYYNKPVIAGRNNGVPDNQDANGLATLADLRSQDDITATIQKVMTNVKAFTPNRKLVMEKFSYAVYKDNWKKIITEVQVQPSTSNPCAE